MGRHDKQREAISGTSKAQGMKALWHPEPLSNTGSLIEPTLDLITTRRKEHRLTGRWRDGGRVCVRELERERKTDKNTRTARLKERKKKTYIQRVTMTKCRKRLDRENR